MKLLALRVIAAGRTLGPYLAIELLLPGGSLVALLLWIYRAYLRAAIPRGGHDSVLTRFNFTGDST